MPAQTENGTTVALGQSLLFFWAGISGFMAPLTSFEANKLIDLGY